MNSAKYIILDQYNGGKVYWGNDLFEAVTAFETYDERVGRDWSPMCAGSHKGQLEEVLGV